jgi:hypothetical protein
MERASARHFIVIVVPVGAVSLGSVRVPQGRGYSSLPRNLIRQIERIFPSPLRAFA